MISQLFIVCRADFDQMCFVGFNTHVKPHDEMLDFLRLENFYENI